LKKRKKVIEHKMCVLSFSTTFVWNNFHSKKNWARNDRKCILVVMESTCFSCPSLMKLEFSSQIFKKSLNIKFRENPYSGSRVVPCVQTDMTKLKVAFCNFANAPKNCTDVNKITTDPLLYWSVFHFLFFFKWSIFLERMSMIS
jgi:hypothetical protein